MPYVQVSRQDECCCPKHLLPEQEQNKGFRVFAAHHTHTPKTTTKMELTRRLLHAGELVHLHDVVELINHGLRGLIFPLLPVCHSTRARGSHHGQHIHTHTHTHSAQKWRTSIIRDQPKLVLCLLDQLFYLPGCDCVFDHTDLNSTKQTSRQGLSVRAGALTGSVRTHILIVPDNLHPVICDGLYCLAVLHVVGHDLSTTARSRN